MEKVYSFLFFVVFYFCFLWHFVFVFCGVPASKFYSKTANDMTSTLWGIERSVTFRGVGRVKYLQITLYSFTMCIMTICVVLLMQFLFTIIKDTRTGQSLQAKQKSPDDSLSHQNGIQARKPGILLVHLYAGVNNIRMEMTEV